MSSVIIVAWKLVEENVYAKPMDGPSNGHREEKDEKKPVEKKEEEQAASSEGRKWHWMNDDESVESSTGFTRAVKMLSHKSRPRDPHKSSR